MKRFIYSVLLFVLPLCLAAISWEYLLRQLPNAYKYKYEWMQANAKDVEVLVLGSSHAYHGILPEFLDGKAFSLANVSQDLNHDKFLLTYSSAKYKNLKRIIVPVSYFTWFGKGLDKGGESYRCRYYKIYMDCNFYPTLSQYSLEVFNLKAAQEKSARLFSSDPNPGCDEYGSCRYQLLDKDQTQWENGKEAEAAVIRHHAKDWDGIERNVSLMEYIVGFCKERGVQLILVTTPCWHSYYDHLDKKQLAKMYELTSRFQTKYNIPYFDYLKDKRFVADDFYDSNHLSGLGAEKFTKILNEDIKSQKNKQ